MSFAKKLARNIKKKTNIGDKKARKEYAKARQSVKDSYVNQLKRDRACRKEAMHNLMGCFLLTMHDRYRFGRGKLERLRDKMQSEVDAMVSGNVSVEEIAAFLEEELELSIGVVGTRPGAGHYEQIKDVVVQQMTAAFLMALLDEFDYKRLRLERAYNFVAELCDRVWVDEITYPEVHSRVDEIMKRPLRTDRTRFSAVTHTDTRASA